jgi:outer membrane lipoprotein-sorting protein
MALMKRKGRTRIGWVGVEIIFIALIVISSGAQSPLDESDEKVARYGLSLLEKADMLLAPEDSQFTMKLVNSGGGKDSASEYECYNRGSDRFLMLFKAPANLAGQAQLKVDGTIYHYIRKVDKTIQTSAKAQFANTLFTQEDVMSRQLSTLYSVVSIEEKDLEGIPVYELILRGKTKDVAYREIRAFFSRKTGFPLRREYYSFSGQLVKRLSIEKLETDAAGRPMRVEMTMTDSIRKGYSSRAVLDFTRYAPVDERYFSRAYLKVLTE